MIPLLVNLFDPVEESINFVCLFIITRPELFQLKHLPGSGLLFWDQGFVSGSMLIIFMACHPKVYNGLIHTSWLGQTLNTSLFQKPPS